VALTIQTPWDIRSIGQRKAKGQPAMEIDGKRALILGASRGIGKAVAMALAQAGARVVLPYFDWPQDTKRMQAEFADAGFDHLVLPADLRQPKQVADLFARIRSEYAGLDIVINNIERGGMPVVHGPYVPGQWDLEMDTTLKAKWWVVHHAMPLLKAESEGVIVTLSSVAAVTGRSGPAGMVFNDGYAAANRAVSSFTETWARQGAPTVRVNELMLGLFDTRHAEGTRGWDQLTDAQQQAIKDEILLQRTGRLQEAVRAVMFLIREATYMTGAVLRLDGGFSLGHSRVPPMPAGIVGEKE
jgi:3-oxoacyl-[acyl-carrier protein] reductase